MLSPEHRKAQKLAEKAALAVRSGHESRAITLFSNAAKMERIALSKMAPSSTRTKGILAVSMVSLLYKAKQYESAESAIFQLLGSRDLLLPADKQLRELLEVVSDEKMLLANGQPKGQRKGK